MRSQSISNKILKRVRGSGRGFVFSAADFVDIGTRPAVDQALSRLAKARKIRRVGRGLYDLPRKSKRLGQLAPSPEVVAQALARKTGQRIQASGAASANSLGLSTQVPAKVLYLTEGNTRRVKFGSQTIELRRAAPRKLTGAGTNAGAALRAIAYLGPGRMHHAELRRLKSILSDKDKRELLELARSAPSWMHPILQEIANSAGTNDA